MIELRDFFAGMVVGELIFDKETRVESTAEFCAFKAYLQADAMLKVREMDLTDANLKNLGFSGMALVQVDDGEYRTDRVQGRIDEKIRSILEREIKK